MHGRPQGGNTLDTEHVWIAMLLAVALVGLLARSVSTPYPILLVAAGLGLGLIPGLHPPPLNPDLILFFFLPVLLYKEAFHTSWHDFSRWVRPIAGLAIGLVAVTIFAVGGVAKLLWPDMPWGVAFILGAVVSPTDTIAATAVLNRLRVPRRLAAILGGESLVNDATGLVALQVAVGVMISGAFGWWQISGAFLWAVLGGLIIGLLAGKTAHEANRRIRDTTILFTISLVAPYVAFASAHALQASGVLAVVTAGFFVSWRIHAVEADTRYDLYAVWRLMAYVVDALAFLLLGIEIPRLVRAASAGELPQLLVAGGLITLTVIAVRILWTYPAAYLPLLLFPKSRRREGAEPKGAVFLTAWCGVRGAVSLAAALAVPLTLHGQPFPGRDAVVFCTFCVILGTLVIQGLTLQPLIRWLGLRQDTNDGEEEQLARVSMIGAALTRLQYLKAKPDVDPAALEHVQAIYLERLRMLDDAPEPGFTRLGSAASTSGLFAIELEALRAERQRLLNLRDTSNINDLTHDRLQEELDVAEMRARTHGRIGSSK